MNVFDWIFIAALALGLVLGIIKGFLKPLLSAIGFVVISFGSSLLAPTVQGWLMNVNMTEDLRPLLALVIAVVGLTIIWVLVSLILRKILTKNKGMGVLNRVIGAVLGLLIVYLVFAVIVALITGLFGELMPSVIQEKIRPEIENSWIYNNIYFEKKNFFGNWVIEKMAEKIIDSIQNAQKGDPESLIQFFKAIRS